jgi:hypothetical protein
MKLGLAWLTIGGGCLGGGCRNIPGAIHRVAVGWYKCLQLRIIILEVTGVSTVPTSIGWRLPACNRLGVEGALTQVVET